MEGRVPEKYSEIVERLVKKAEEHNEHPNHVVSGSDIEALLGMGAEFIRENEKRSDYLYLSEVVYNNGEDVYHFITLPSIPFKFIIDPNRM